MYAIYIVVNYGSKKYKNCKNKRRNNGAKTDREVLRKCVDQLRRIDFEGNKRTKNRKNIKRHENGKNKMGRSPRMDDGRNAHTNTSR